MLTYVAFFYCALRWPDLHKRHLAVEWKFPIGLRVYPMRMQKLYQFPSKWSIVRSPVNITLVWLVFHKSMGHDGFAHFDTVNTLFLNPMILAMECKIQLYSIVHTFHAGISPFRAETISMIFPELSSGRLMESCSIGSAFYAVNFFYNQFEAYPTCSS